MTKEKKSYYRFILENALKGLIWIAAIIGIYLLLKHFLPDAWVEVLWQFADRPNLIFSIFFASETLFGIIPLEFFIFWASKKALNMYVVYVLVLACLSYIGALVAYGVGRLAKHIAWLKRLSELESFQQYSKLYRRWGGVVIILSALTPLPFATISFLSAALYFPLNRYLLYSATRFIRFAIVAWVVWSVGI